MKFSPKSNYWDSLLLIPPLTQTQFSLNNFCVKIVTQLLQDIKIDVSKGEILLLKNVLHLVFLSQMYHPQPWTLLSLSV